MTGLTVTADSLTVGDIVTLGKHTYNVEAISFDITQEQEEVAVSCQNGKLLIFGKDMMVALAS